VVSPSVHQFAALSNKSVRRERTQDGIYTHRGHLWPQLSSPAVIAPCPSSFERRGNRRNALEERMLREIVVEEEMPGDFLTTFRLRVDGNVIAENKTELERQFLVSEMLERIPSLRVAASDDAEQP
jgi:hypothetical protein